MVETSHYWESTITGDATLAPYTPLVYSLLQKKTLSRENGEGIIRNFLNTLNVSGSVGGITVNTGGALVEGTFYINSSQVTKSMATPVSNPRIDRIILRKDYLAQTIRIEMLTGTENAKPVAPDVSIIEGTKYEISLATALITTGGDITVTPDNEIINTPLAPNFGFVHIETLTAEGDNVGTLEFSNISQDYKTLMIISTGKVASTESPQGFGFKVQSARINNSSGSDYLLQDIAASNITVDSTSSINASGHTISEEPDELQPVAYRGQGVAIFPNYTGIFFKTMLQTSNVITDTGSISPFIQIYGGLYDLDTLPTTNILVGASNDVFASGSRYSLYGLK